MIKKYSLMALEKAINQTLALDDSMPNKIKSFHGKVLEVIINPLNVFFFITFNDGKLELLSDYQGTPDTIIHSSPIGLIRLSLLPSSKVRSLFNDKIRIVGDIELGQQIKTLFDQVDIDWEGHLAHFTGDVVAYQIGSLVRDGQAFQQRITSSICRNVTEYLHEEIRLFPCAEEVNDFFNDIDNLSLHVDRLSAHIHQLLNKNELN